MARFISQRAPAEDSYSRTFLEGRRLRSDLILDLVVARSKYNNTIFCIDEPESHMHANLQAELLTERTYPSKLPKIDVGNALNTAHDDAAGTGY